VPPAPDGVAVVHTATTVNLTWTPLPALPTPAAAPAPVEPAPAAPAEPVAPAATPDARPPATPAAVAGVNIYVVPPPRAEAPAAPAAPAWQVTRPTPLNATPVASPPFTTPVVFDVEACYQMRSVIGQGANAVEGPPSAPACITPTDTFPPAAPVQLVAVATAGAINLLWEANAEPDLAGYIVLRGAVGDAVLQPLNQMPTTEVRFADMTVVSGMRYVYAVIAVDRRAPVANVSPESARVEETAQ
jgi:hypothetical protein